MLRKKLELLCSLVWIALRQRWHALRACLALWLSPLRWFWPALLAPRHIQAEAVLLPQRSGAPWQRHRAATRLLQRAWGNAVARGGPAVQLTLFEDVAPFWLPCLVLWRSHGQRFAVYYPERCPLDAAPLRFPPTLARPRGGSLWGGPRNDHYRGAAWETPSWLRENPPQLGNLE